MNSFLKENALKLKFESYKAICYLLSNCKAVKGKYSGINKKCWMISPAFEEERVV